MNKLILLSLISSAAASLALPTLASDSTDFNLTIESGLRYDNALGVSELDQQSNQADQAVQLQAKLDAKWRPTQRLTLKGGYSYKQQDYQQYDQFDLQLQQLFADIAINIAAVTIGLNHHYVAAELHGEDLLTLNQSTLYASHLFNQRYFCRVYLEHKNTGFDGRAERDASGAAAGGDLYLFSASGRSYITIGLEGEQQVAASKHYDFDGLEFRSKLAHKFSLLGRDSQLQLGWRYQDRNYTAPGSALIENSERLRADSRQTTELLWEVSLTDFLTATSKFEYGDYRSTLDSADYHQTTASLGLRATF